MRRAWRRRHRLVGQRAVPRPCRIRLNGAVALALVAVCGSLVLLGLVSPIWRRVVDERRSVHDYQHTLDALRTVSDRSGRDHEQARADPAPVLRLRRDRPGHRADRRRDALRRVRELPVPVVAAASDEPPVTQPAGPPASALPWDRGPGIDGGGAATDEPTRLLSAVAPVAAPEDEEGSSPLEQRQLAPVPDRRSTEPGGDAAEAGGAPEIVFDDVAPAPAPADRSAAAQRDPALWAMARAAGAAVATGGTRRGRPAGSVRAVRVVTVAAAVLLVVALAAVVASQTRSGRKGSVAAPRSTSASGATAGRSGSTPTPPSGDAGASAVSAVHPTSATAFAATVAAPASSYTVVVSVTGRCWIEGKRTDTGNDVWSGTLTAGQRHSFSFAGPVLLRIGAANAAVTMDGAPVALPQGYQAPYDVTFQPA